MPSSIARKSRSTTASVTSVGEGVEGEVVIIRP
jgi:hypothetical protein